MDKCSIGIHLGKDDECHRKKKLPENVDLLNLLILLKSIRSSFFEGLHSQNLTSQQHHVCIMKRKVLLFTEGLL